MADLPVISSYESLKVEKRYWISTSFTTSSNLYPARAARAQAGPESVGDGRLLERFHVIIFLSDLCIFVEFHLTAASSFSTHFSPPNDVY